MSTRTIEKLERKANIATLIAGLSCGAVIAVLQVILIRRINASTELNYLPVLFPCIYSIPAIVFKLAHQRIQARLHVQIAELAGVDTTIIQAGAVDGRRTKRDLWAAFSWGNMERTAQKETTRSDN